jgi:NAD(P)-dependent dehydrogenase (short-subunit alcohol dehydrogenase family)
MDLGLSGRRAIVTGASKGIGLAVTQTLVAEGVYVVAASRGTSEELMELGTTGLVREFPVDLSSDSGPESLVAAALEDGAVDILINNAGSVTPRLNGFSAITDAQWSATLTLTLMAAVRTCRAVVPQMVANGHGVIVNNASVNATLPDPVVMDYGAAKAALVNFSKALSKEHGPQGIRVNTVSPGPVSTALWLGSSGVAATLGTEHDVDPDVIAAQAVTGTATGRFTTPQEVADLIVYLASDRSGNVTGADFIIDGGLIQTI